MVDIDNSDVGYAAIVFVEVLLELYVFLVGIFSNYLVDERHIDT
jgi:hypothetical protein